MESSKASTRFVPGVVLGSILGAAVGATLTMRLTRGEPRGEPAASALPEVAGSSSSRVSEDPLSRLARRVAAIEQRHAALSRRGAEEGLSPRPSEDELDRQLAEHWAAERDAHGAEAVDAAWAAHMERALRQQIEPLATAYDFRLLAIDCRTTRCAARVEFSSFSRARADYVKLLREPPDIACSREAVLPEPARHEAPYRATVLYVCDS